MTLSYKMVMVTLTNNTMLENVNSEKLLWVIIDKYLSWKHHIDKTAKTLSKNIALLKRIRKYLPHQTRLTFYKTFIQPHIDYFSAIWGQSPHISRIHILQKISLINTYYECAQSNTLCTTFQRMSGYANSRSGQIQNCHNGVQNLA